MQWYQRRIKGLLGKKTWTKHSRWEICSNERIVLPEELKEQNIEFAHEGHLGRSLTKINKEICSGFLRWVP